MRAGGKLLVFSKAAVPGKVKTRLAKDIGDEAACEIHKLLVDRTLDTGSQSQFSDKELWCTPDLSDPFLNDVAEPYGFSMRVQDGADLGERMSNALTDALKTHLWAVLVGTDCPALTACDLDEVSQALASGTEVAIGPALDGGYYLIGLTEPVPELFSGVSWGQSSVLETTRHKVGQLGLSSKEFNEYRDIDYLKDILEYRDLLDF